MITYGKEYLPESLVITTESGGEIIKKLRKEQEILQLDFAAEWDIHPNTLYNFEHGVHEPRFDMVMDMLQTYGFEVIIRRK